MYRKFLEKSNIAGKAFGSGKDKVGKKDRDDAVAMTALFHYKHL